jgi:hypothetical protein
MRQYGLSKVSNIESHTKIRSARFLELLQTGGVRADMVQPTGVFLKLFVSKAQNNTRHERNQ